jgi:Zn finger protein HypA/HybF involved in hydrogenase expression
MSVYAENESGDWRDLPHEKGPSVSECLGCHEEYPTWLIDEDGLCPQCEADDDELDDMGEEPWK